MIRKDPQLKVQFDRIKNENPEIAANPYAQLQWFYLQTPYYDQSVGLYPVGKVVSKDVLKILESLH